MKKYIAIGFIAVLLLSAALVAVSADRTGKYGGKSGKLTPVVYVESQGLYYDSIVTADPLPWKGPFQKLYMGPNGLTTQYGPGDPGYKGGRWWMDTNGNGYQDADDHYFSCPLLGPGYE